MRTGARGIRRKLHLMTAVAGLLFAVRASPLSLPAASVRFHHLHFRAAEPAASMNQAAIALKGTRVLLRGHGVGVRVGGEYALFDRLDASEVPSDARPSISSAYAAAREWLSAHGVEVDADRGTTRTDFEAMFASELLDHIGFTTGDTSAVVAALVAHGAKPVRQTDDSRLFRTAKHGAIEIVRDVDAPDAFWCPMHPDIRSAVAGRCPLCKMELVPIPPPRVGEYRMDVAVTPGPGGRGASKLRLTIRDPATNRPLSSFATIHERLLHLFIIDRQLESFRHVHPEHVYDGVLQLREHV